MATNIPILRLGRRLIVPLSGDLHDQLVVELQSEILARIEATAASGLILELTALDFVDSFMARVLNDIAMMARLMGTQVILSGMSPTVAIVLMDLGLQLPGIPTARDLEQAIERLDALIAEEEGLDV